MQGQLSDSQFKQLLISAGMFRYHVDYANKRAWIRYGKYTHNYYLQHEDGSWTNYDCKTSN